MDQPLRIDCIRLTMDIANIVLFISVLFFTYRGYRTGALKASSQILGLIGGYGASLYFTQPAAQWLEGQTSLPPLVYTALAAVGLFISVSVSIKLALQLLIRPLPESFKSSPLIHWAGAGIGAAAGVLVALIVLWFYGLLSSVIQPPPSELSTGLYAKTPSPSQPSTTEPSMGQQLLDQASSMVARQIVEVRGEQDLISQAAAQLMAQPGETLQSLQRLSRHPSFKSLMQSQQPLLMTGDSQQIAALPEFTELRNDADMQALFPVQQVSDQQLAELLITYWQRGINLHNDPELQALLSDPEVQQQLQSGNPLTLFTHPKTSRLMSALLSGNPPQPTTTKTLEMEVEPSADKEPSAHKEPSADNTKIYRWQDPQGRTHYSDQPPEETGH